MTGLCVGALAFAGLDASAFIPYATYNTYQKLEYLTWPWASLNDVNNDGDISGSNEGIEIVVEGGANGFTDAEQETVREAFDVWQDVSTSYVAFQLLGPTSDPMAIGEDVNDYINSVSIQVDTDVTTVDGVGDGVLGRTILTVVVDDGLYPDSATSASTDATDSTNATDTTGSSGSSSTETTDIVSTYVSGGQILEGDIVIDGASHRALAGEKPLASLRATLVHEIGHFIGLAHTPLNNLEAALANGTAVLMESPVIALRDASNVLKLVGATPTMFPTQFYTDDGQSNLDDGSETLAPDDIAGVSFLYPRGSQDGFFSIEQEVRNQITSSSIPSVPIVGSHVVAWCDVDNDATTPRIPLFSTLSGFYQMQEGSGGKFALYGLYKNMETMTSAEAFSATYTFTSSPLNSLSYSRQAPIGYTADDFFGTWATLSPTTPAFVSEVFHEDGNILDVDKHDLGTAMKYDRTRSKAVSVESDKTLDAIRPWIEPMFGDPDPVCPWNIVFDSNSTNSSTNSSATIKSLRRFRDEVLLKTTVGTAFVDMYYHAAPIAAGYLARHSGVLSALRFAAPGVEWSVMHSRMLFAVIAACAFTLLIGRRRGKALAMGIFIALIALSSTPSFGSLMNLSDEDMVKMSDDIVTGTVQLTESHYRRVDGNRGIVTDITILLTDDMKEGASKGSTIHMTIMGGRVGNVMTIASETPAFTTGQEVLLYLRAKTDGSYSVIAGPRGKFEVETEKSSGKKYVAASSEAASTALALTVTKKADTNQKNVSDKSDDKISLEDYKAYIRSIIEKQKK
jgi:hypothetical protein